MAKMSDQFNDLRKAMDDLVKTLIGCPEKYNKLSEWPSPMFLTVKDGLDLL